MPPASDEGVERVPVDRAELGQRVASIGRGTVAGSDNPAPMGCRKLGHRSLGCLRIDHCGCHHDRSVVRCSRDGFSKLRRCGRLAKFEGIRGSGTQTLPDRPPRRDPRSRSTERPVDVIVAGGRGIAGDGRVLLGRAGAGEIDAAAHAATTVAVASARPPSPPERPWATLPVIVSLCKATDRRSVDEEAASEGIAAIASVTPVAAEPTESTQRQTIRDGAAGDGEAQRSPDRLNVRRNSSPFGEPACSAVASTPSKPPLPPRAYAPVTVHIRQAVGDGHVSGNVRGKIEAAALRSIRRPHHRRRRPRCLPLRRRPRCW